MIRQIVTLTGSIGVTLGGNFPSFTARWVRFVAQTINIVTNPVSPVALQVGYTPPTEITLVGNQLQFVSTLPMGTYTVLLTVQDSCGNLVPFSIVCTVFLVNRYNV